MMKKIILSTFALLMAFSVGAQTIKLNNGRSNTLTYTGNSTLSNGMAYSEVGISDLEHNSAKKSLGWRRATLSYVTPSFRSDSSDDRNLDFGISAAYLTTVHLDKSLQLFLEWGGALSYAGCSSNALTTITTTTTTVVSDGNEDEEKYYEEEYESTVNQTTADTYIDIKIPANLTYRFNFGGELSILPYVGVNLKVGIISSRKYTIGDESESVSLYDEEKVGSEQFNRINFGMQYGFNISYKSVTIGYGWENDFTETYEGAKYRSSAITIGYLF